MRGNLRAFLFTKTSLLLSIYIRLENEREASVMVSRPSAVSHALDHFLEQQPDIFSRFATGLNVRSAIRESRGVYNVSRNLALSLPKKIGLVATEDHRGKVLITDLSRVRSSQMAR